MTILLLAVEFFLTGLFAVGGGLATLPFLTQMGMKYPGWFTQEMLVNMIAISESTPGPIGINMATYVGYTVGKIPGALVATLSLVLPSLIVLLLIAKMLDKYCQSALLRDLEQSGSGGPDCGGRLVGSENCRVCRRGRRGFLDQSGDFCRHFCPDAASEDQEAPPDPLYCAGGGAGRAAQAELTCFPNAIAV